MKKITIFITTYNRPNLLQLLLDDIRREQKGFDLFIRIINDHSSLDYSQVKTFLEDHFPGKYQYSVNKANRGKKHYWQTINEGYREMKDQSFDYFIQLPDDVRLVKGFFKQAMKAFEAIQDDFKSCLSLLTEVSRMMKPCWTNYQPYWASFPGFDCIRTGWMDMCFISGRRFFEYLDYRIEPVDIRWSSNPGLSSGVGRQISQKLIAQGAGIYALKKSLVIHDHHPSVMHPDHRQDVPLVTNHDMPPVVATIATMPGREISLEESVRSIIHQVDELRIYANNLHKMPFNLHSSKIKWLYSEDHAGDLGDAGKFYQAELINGYHFTLDDDLIYPQDYVATMVAAIERYDRRCAISLHGRILPAGKISSYYKNSLATFSFKRSLARDKFVHIIGTGVLAYHTDTIRLSLDKFPVANMADIWFARACQERGVPRVIIAHNAGWVMESLNYDQFSTIYTQNVHDDSEQTRVVNSLRWTMP